MSTKKVIKDTEMLNKEVVDDVVDIDLSATSKKRFRIDGDNNRILYLNTSDLSMISRLDTAQKDLEEIQKSILDLRTNIKEDDEDFAELGEKFKEADKKMRDLVDYIFDAPVSEVCAPDGSMYDPFEGKFRFEFIIDRLIVLYESSISTQAKALSARSRQHTAKYTKK